MISNPKISISVLGIRGFFCFNDLFPAPFFQSQARFLLVSHGVFLWSFFGTSASATCLTSLVFLYLVLGYFPSAKHTPFQWHQKENSTGLSLLHQSRKDADASIMFIRLHPFRFSFTSLRLATYQLAASRRWSGRLWRHRLIALLSPAPHIPYAVWS